MVFQFTIEEPQKTCDVSKINKILAYRRLNAGDKPLPYKESLSIDRQRIAICGLAISDFQKYLAFRFHRHVFSPNQFNN